MTMTQAAIALIARLETLELLRRFDAEADPGFRALLFSEIVKRDA